MVSIFHNPADGFYTASDDEAAQLLAAGDIQRPRQHGYVVHEVVNSKPNTVVWAWCLVIEEQPGYAEITYTRNDGSTPVPFEEKPQLGPVITKVWC